MNRSLLWLFFISLLPVLIYFSIGFVIPIHEVQCVSQYGACTGSLREKVENIKGLNLNSARKEIRRLLVGDFYAKEYTYQYEFPSKIKLHILERKPNFALVNESQAWFAIIDKDGYVLSLEESSGLPKVITSGPIPNPGEKVETRELFALNLMSDLSYLFQVDSGRMDGESLVIDLDDATDVIFPLEGEKDVLVGSLVLLGNRILEGKDENARDLVSVKKTIDLRYKNAVIKLKS